MLPRALPMRLSKLSLASKALSITTLRRRDGSIKRMLTWFQRPLHRRLHLRDPLRERLVLLAVRLHRRPPLRRCLHFRWRPLHHLSMVLDRVRHISHRQVLHLSINHAVNPQPCTRTTTNRPRRGRHRWRWQQIHLRDRLRLHHQGPRLE